MGRVRRLALGIMTMWILAPVVVFAQNGSLEFRYERLERSGQVLRPDGTFRDTTFVRSFWTQNYLAAVSRRFGSRLFVAVQGQYNRQNYFERADRFERPYGQLRITHPSIGLTASYQPTTTTQEVSAGRAFGGVADTGATETLSFRAEQSLVSAYLSPANLPRVDVSWIRRHNAADVLNAERTQDQRNARLHWALGPLSVRGGYGDLSRGVEPSSLGDPIQRHYDAGAGLAIAPLPGVAFNADYGVNRFVRGLEGAAQDQVLSHALTASGSYQQTSRLGWSVSYRMNRTEQTNGAEGIYTHHEGQLAGSWRPTSVLGLQGAAGARTVRTGASEGIERFASSVASIGGRVMQDWNADANVSQSVNWSREGAAYATTQGRVGSRWRLRRGLEASGNYQVAVDRDTASDSRLVSQWSFVVTASPWRSFRIRLAESRFQVRSDGTFEGGSSQNRVVDIRWAPLPALELTGNVSTSGVPPRNDTKTTSTTLAAQWSLSHGLQVSGNYASTNSVRSNALVSQVPGREVTGMRLTWSPVRRWSVGADLTLVDPSRSNKARQFGATYTYRFGR